VSATGNGQIHKEERKKRKFLKINAKNCSENGELHNFLRKLSSKVQQKRLPFAKKCDNILGKNQKVCKALRT
jgi:hypothetical protein